jgi:hypothetical protein
VLAGLPAAAVARDVDADQITLALAGLARLAAPVTVHWVPGEGDWPYVAGQRCALDAAAWMWASRRGGAWPAGWTEGLQRDYQARKLAYRRALFEDITGDALDVAA